MRLRLALLAAVAAISAAPALGAPQGKLPSGVGEIMLMEFSGQTRERALVESIVPEAVGQPMETGVYDLDEDGKPEVVARLKGAKFCDEKAVRCRTVVLRAGSQGWAKVLDRPAQKVEAGTLGFGGMRALLVDGREAFNWTGTAYKIDVGAAGVALSFQEPAASFRAPLIAQFGPGAAKLAARNKGVTVKIAQAGLQGDGTSVVVARLEGPGACGAVMGCPWRILQAKAGAYNVLSVGLGGAKMSVLPVMRGGWRDVMVATPRGYAVYGWTGKRYVVAENMVEGAQ